MKNEKFIYVLMVVAMCMLFIILCVALASRSYAVGAGEVTWTNKMMSLHSMADQARALGYSEDSAIIKALSNAWWQEWEDMNILAKVVHYEADPSICEWEHSLAVAVVILNRANSEYFPNTVKGVVAAPNQYLPAYTWGFEGTPAACYEVARQAMDGDHDIPEDCFWQAEFPQGVKTWKIFRVDTGYYSSTTYICRGIR